MLVRREFSEEAVWRDTLGNSAQLYPLALHGFAIDAPEHYPAGSMLASNLGTYKSTVQRAGFWGK